MNEFGKRIFARLEAKGITQREFADMIGVTEVSMSRFISGARMPRGPIIANMATVLGCSIDELMGVEQKRKAGWIPVKEKLPEKAGRYLVTARWNENMDYLVDTLDYGFKVNEDWHGTDYIFPNGGAFGEDWNGEMDNLEKDILAWMPLPEPYQEDKA